MKYKNSKKETFVFGEIEGAHNSDDKYPIVYHNKILIY